MKTVSAFQITNFKAFGAAQRMPLRPITLIYGANSAGKSSILHALALAHHAIETGDLDTRRTRIGGESIDLGGFRQYVHGRDRDRQVELVFELDPGRLSGRMEEILRPARRVAVELAVGGGFANELPVPSGDTAREPDREGGIRLERFSVQADGSSLLSMSVRGDGLFRLDRLDHDHPILRESLREILALVTTIQDVNQEDFDGMGEVLNDLVSGVTARQHGLFPRIDDKLEKPGENAGGDLLTISQGRRQRDLAQAARLFLPRVLHDLVEGISSIIETAVRDLVYLGPLRSCPPRHLAFPQHHDPNWLAGGGHAWDVVRVREDVRERVNKWLGDSSRMKTPYALEVLDFLPAVSMPGELSSKLEMTLHGLFREFLSGLENEGPSILRTLSEAAQGVTGQVSEVAREFTEQVNEAAREITEQTTAEVDDIFRDQLDTEHIFKRWIDEIVESYPDGLQDLILVDKRSATAVSHRDVGIGVSQVLPVLVSAYASSGKLLAIEQPEIHLHPALQAELGDVFLESALGGGGNTLVIESHSEHLLLRIMRRMRETSTGKLPDGIPEVCPEDVMVLFVEPDGEQSLIREMPLNERGDLVKAWPGGFFEEGLREIF